MVVVTTHGPSVPRRLHDRRFAGAVSPDRGAPRGTAIPPLDLDRQPECLAQRCRRQRGPIGPAATARPAARRLPEAGRDLLDMVSDEDQAARRRPRRKATEVADERLPGAEVEARSGLVEDQQVRVHQGPGDLDPPFLARRQRPERVVVESAGADLIEELAGAVAVCRVGVPPRREGGVPGGDHDVEGRQARVDRRLEAGARVADLAPEVAGIDPADRLAEDFERWSARDRCSRRGRASSCPIRSGQGRPSARRRRRPSRSAPGSSVRSAARKRPSTAGSRSRCYPARSRACP